VGQALVALRRAGVCDPDLVGESEEIAPRAVLTERARAEIAHGFGPAEHSVAQAARDFGVSWHAAMATVSDHGRPRVDHLSRLGAPSAVGLDETSFLAGTAQHPTMLVTGIIDLDEGRLVEVLPARSAIAVTDWLTAKPAPWLAGIRHVVIDPYQPYATAVAAGLPDARLVVDHFHVIRLANAALDEVRRRVQQTTTATGAARTTRSTGSARRLPASHDRLRQGPSAARVPTAAPEGEAMSRRTPRVFQDPTGAWRLCSPQASPPGRQTASGAASRVHRGPVWRSGLAVLRRRCASTPRKAMARSNSRTPRRVVSSLEGWRACERPRPRAWVMVSASWRAVCSNASAWSDGSSWSQWSASSRLWCHTRCAASNGLPWGECVDVGSEPLLGASASGVGRSVLTTYRRCDAVGGAGVRRRLSVGGDPAEWLDSAGIATSPVGLAGSRVWDRLRTSTGIDRIAGAGARRRRPSGEGLGRKA